VFLGMAVLFVVMVGVVPLMRRPIVAPPADGAH
jgi:hypothetical protein